jgi:hypothetical protein
MIIKLPKKFYYTTNNSNSFAYVADGILYISGYINFEDLMYSLTYTIFGYDKCRYCGKLLTPADRSLDHIYPRSWGGVSIPNNLLPSCKMCNQNKADMAPYQYNRWLKLETHEERREYYKKCHKENSKRALNGKFILPHSWYEDFDVTKLFHDMDFSCLEQFKIDKVNEYYETNHQYNHPIVVSSDNWLLKGKHIIYHAIVHEIKTVPAIVLENVVVIRDAC